MAMIRSGYSMISGKEPDTKATELSNNPAIKIGDAPFGLRTGSPFCSFKSAIIRFVLIVVCTIENVIAPIRIKSGIQSGA